MKSRVGASEAHLLIVFVEERQVIRAVEISRGDVDFCPKLGILRRARAESSFTVTEGWGGKHCLRWSR
jgi:hypothetical protein